jgi:hypothetical protein
VTLARYDLPCHSVRSLSIEPSLALKLSDDPKPVVGPKLKEGGLVTPKPENADAQQLIAVCPACREEMPASSFAKHIKTKHPEYRKDARPAAATE